LWWACVEKTSKKTHFSPNSVFFHLQISAATKNIQSNTKNDADFSHQKYKVMNFSYRWMGFSNIKGMWKELMWFKDKRDNLVFCISTVERLDFKKLGRAASRKMDSKDEKHDCDGFSVESQTSRNHFWWCWTCVCRLSPDN